MQRYLEVRINLSYMTTVLHHMVFWTEIHMCF